MVGSIESRMPPHSLLCHVIPKSIICHRSLQNNRQRLKKIFFTYLFCGLVYLCFINTSYYSAADDAALIKLSLPFAGEDDEVNREAEERDEREELMRTPSPIGDAAIGGVICECFCVFNEGLNT